MKKLLIVDGHFLAMRSHFAVLRSSSGGLFSPQGLPISVCTGFLSELGSLISSTKPTHLLVAFDSDVPNFRTEIYPEYKANRSEKPDGFSKDLFCLQDVLASIGICAIALPRYEGDDVIATAVKWATSHKNLDFVDIYSPDKDLLQLLDEDKKVAIINLNKEFVRWSNVVDAYGITPTQIIDFKSLAGDQSDNIKGVKGIGAKQSATILGHYSVDEILSNIDNLDKITIPQRNKIKNDVDSIRLAQKIVKLVSDLPIKINIDTLKIEQINIPKNKDKINDLGLASVCFKLALILQNSQSKSK